MTSSDGPAEEQATGTGQAPEPTPGYWESQAQAERPTSDQQPPPPPYPPQYAQPGYPPQYAQPGPPPQYAQPGYPPQYAQPGYPPQYATASYGYPVYGPPEHPKTNLAFVLGLLGGPGALMTCGLSLLAAPFAWFYAVVVRREMAAAPGYYDPNTGKVTAGLVLGIIGTTLLTIVVILIAVLIVVAIADPTAFDDGTTV